SGTTCPGRARSDGRVPAAASRRMVYARSAAEMPVATPSRASTATAYAVPRRSWLVWYIGGSSSRSACSSVIGTQTYPDVCRTMNAISSAVACSAAKIRSPSFSRSSSSTTITGRPAAMSATARSMSSNTALSQHLLDVLGDDVDLEVHRVAGGLDAEHGRLERRRDQPDAELLRGHRH